MRIDGLQEFEESCQEISHSKQFKNGILKIFIDDHSVKFWLVDIEIQPIFSWRDIMYDFLEKKEMTNISAQ